MSGTEKLPDHRISRTLIISDCVGGVWSYTIQLARDLTSRGVQVLVATIGPAPSHFQMEEVQSIGGVRLEHIGYRLEWMEGGCDDLELCRKRLLELEALFSPDIIHSNSYSVANSHFRAPVITVAHSCVYSWWRAVRGTAPPAEWANYREAVTAGLRAAAAVVAPSYSMLCSLADNYELCLPYSRVIHNGAARPAPVLFSKRPMILAAGRIWDESKNFSLLDAVAPHLRWPTCIAGAVESPAGRRPSLQNVQLLGALQQQVLHEWMCNAAIFAHPAQYEPFGLAVLEAAQRGCALVLSDIASLRELWGDAALFCNPRNADEWTTNLKLVRDNDNLRFDLARKARLRADHFTTDRMVDQYQELYRKLIGSYKHDVGWRQAS